MFVLLVKLEWYKDVSNHYKWEIKQFIKPRFLKYRTMGGKIEEKNGLKNPFVAVIGPLIIHHFEVIQNIETKFMEF